MKVKIIGLLWLAIIVLFTGCSENELFNESADSGDELLKSSTQKVTYIVTLKSEDVSTLSYGDKKNKSYGRALGVLKRAGINDSEITQVYGSALQGFAVNIAPGQLKKLQLDGDVSLVEEDKIVSLAPKDRTVNPNKPSKEPAPTEPEPTPTEPEPTPTPTEPEPTPTPTEPVVSTQVLPWGVKRVGGGVACTGTAWIIDTGIDLDHPDLNVNVAKSVVFVTGTAVTPDDLSGHGTHVAGIVAAKDNLVGVVGVAAGASVVAVRVLDATGSGYLSWVIAGVDYVAANAKIGDVANLSLGGGISTTLDNAVINAAAKGIKMVVAAGNAAIDAINSSPARVNVPNVYTISAMDSYDKYASFSNYGSVVDYCAPGVNIYSTYKDGRYGSMSGTSMAAPHVSGLLLLGNLNTDGFVLNDPDGNADPIAHK